MEPDLEAELRGMIEDRDELIEKQNIRLARLESEVKLHRRLNNMRYSQKIDALIEIDILPLDY